MDDDFVEIVKLLVPYVLSRDMMLTKHINGLEVTGEDLLKYIRAFVIYLKNDEFPSPQTAFNATAAVGRQLAIDAAFKVYKEEMEKVCNLADGESLSESDLKDHSEVVKDLARKKLKKFPRMQIPKHEFECLGQLDALMEQKYQDLKEIIEKQNQNVVLQKLAKKAATAKELATAVATGAGIAVGTVGTVALGVVIALKR